MAAKHHVLKRVGIPVPDLAVFDESGIAAHWGGHCGYTNGELPLGTPPEKDIGYPYLTDEAEVRADNRRINTEMLRYSWAAFNVAEDERNFAEWIDRGRPRPPHKIWALYLQWVARQVDLEVEKDRLAGVSIDGDRWSLDFESGRVISTDGIVITSPGPAKRDIDIKGPAKAVFNGKTFWGDDCEARLSEIGERPKAKACVIGSGETAAAIVLYLAERLPNIQIDIVSREGIIYTRGESFEENRLYSDPGSWGRFKKDVRKMFVKRTDRGVFSVATKELLDAREDVVTLSGEVTKIDATKDNGIFIVVRGRDDPCGPYEIVADATGFRRRWFIDMLDEDSFHKLTVAMTLSPEAIPTDEQLEEAIDYDLSVSGLHPKMHLPMYAGLEQGPGFPSLGCLGFLSDRILRPYWMPTTGMDNAAASSRISIRASSQSS
ncbi:MAG: lysine 6-monooxygenase [Solirubrobacterales bacterium]